MRPQDRRQRAQKNQAIALQIIMMMAGIGIGTYFVTQAPPSTAGFKCVAGGGRSAQSRFSPRRKREDRAVPASVESTVCFALVATRS